ncbi:MAG: KamA family radical SAM protein [Deltaproteobacteria bacterium]|nr:KamA family radical SAM protein [Deltaproteobacteria bacterium]
MEGFNSPDIDQVVKIYPMLINPYYFNLIRSDNRLMKQAIPDIREIESHKGYIDPLDEENLSPVPGLTHKYPDRVLFLISGRCAMYCRFCNRKRKVGHPSMVTEESIKEGLRYIEKTKTIRDVLLSGGDPLLLSDERLDSILSKVKAIDHVEIIRIGSRVPCTLPQRITPELLNIFKKHHPLYINTHFNHPAEITPESSMACKMIADAGIPLGCQTVLLKGINDDIVTISELMRRLLAIRVKPYYLFQADLVKGTSHFWTPLTKGIEIMAGLQGNISGIGVPRFVIDLPYGGGKIPVLPEYVKAIKGDQIILRNYQGIEFRYPVIS